MSGHRDVDVAEETSQVSRQASSFIYQDYFPSIIEDTATIEWSVETFEDRISKLSKKSDKNDGKIFYNTGYFSGHFETNVPSPFRLTTEEIEKSSSLRELGRT